MDITKQVLAVQALLKKANNLILRDHMDHCVKEAIDNKKPEEKLKELSELMDLIQQWKNSWLQRSFLYSSFRVVKGYLLSFLCQINQRKQPQPNQPLRRSASAQPN